MVINTNLQAQITADNLAATQARLNSSLARLSSGLKIVSPADDAGGLAVSTQLDAQVKRTEAANNNVTTAISFTQTQDGYLSKIANALNRMSELSISAQDGTKSDADRVLYNNEFTQLTQYVQSAATKDFNGVSLFGGNIISITIDSEGNTFPMTTPNLSVSAYLNATSANISSSTAAAAALNVVKQAITQLSTDRATIGAYQARLNYTADQLTISKENLSAASSRIKDVDIADESTEYSQQNILLQSGTAMLAQANQLPQSVLQLLQ